MSASNFAELKAHLGHKIAVVTYGDANAAVECETCSEVLLDFDNVAEAESDDEHLGDTAIVVRGNLSDGFTFHGPYPSWDDAAGVHGPDTWVAALWAPDDESLWPSTVERVKSEAAVVAQLKHIEEHGGSEEAYVTLYGAYGKAIFEADMARLKLLLEGKA